MVMSASPRHCEERSIVARMSEATCGATCPGYRCAHPGYGPVLAVTSPTSREQPVHIPVGGQRPALLVLQFALIETIAEYPEAQAFGVLDAEIVTGKPPTILPPPFHGD